MYTLMPIISGHDMKSTGGIWGVLIISSKLLTTIKSVITKTEIMKVKN